MTAAATERFVATAGAGRTCATVMMDEPPIIMRLNSELSRKLLRNSQRHQLVFELNLWAELKNHLRTIGRPRLRYCPRWQAGAPSGIARAWHRLALRCRKPRVPRFLRGDCAHNPQVLHAGRAV